MLFSALQEQQRFDWSFTASCSYLEIYREQIRDLLAVSSEKTLDIKLGADQAPQGSNGHRCRRRVCAYIRSVFSDVRLYQ